MDIIEALMKIGLTRHESVLYIALCKEGELTGYEAAKVSGIPRSNAYLALAGLVEKGGAYRIDSEAVKYTAVPVKELINNIRRQLEQIFDHIEKSVPEKELERDPYISVSGLGNVINKMKNMIEEAEERIYISVSPGELKYVDKELKDAVARGLKVVIITSEDFEMEGATVYHTEKSPGQVRLIVDTSFTLTGELSDMVDCTCLYSKNKNLIQLIRDALKDEITLIQMQN